MMNLSFLSRKRDFLKACRLGDMDSVREFISRGGDPNVKDRSSRTGLLYAAEANRSEIVRKLIASGAEIDYADAKGWTALILACKEGHIEVVRALLEAGNSYSEIKSVPVTLEKEFSGGTPLMIAAGQGYSEIVMLILEALKEGLLLGDGFFSLGRMGKWKVLDQFDLGLFAAVYNGHLDMARILLELGVDPNFEFRGQEVIRLAYESDQMQMVDLLRSYGAHNFNPGIVKACKLGLVDDVERYLANGADPNITDETGLPLLVAAARAGQTQIVELLVEDTSLSFIHLSLKDAARNGHWDSVKLLLEHGANVNYTDKSGGTILMNILTPVSPFLWNSGIMRGIESLLDWGIDVNARDKSGDSALLLLLKLIKKRSTGFAKDSYKVELHDLFLNITDILLRYGADLNVTDSSGNTPMSLARKTNLKDLTGLLEAHGRKSRSMEGNHLRLVED